MHYLDLVMYFVIIILITLILDLISDGDFTEELGGVIIWFPITIIYTIVYIIIFVFKDYNWSDIFNTILK